jgi:RNA polymerase sigma factor (TIGR02999 family)
MLLAMSDVTRILSQIEDGDPAAAEKLLPLVYDELRKLAAVKLAQEKPGQTLQATALVHEAYVKLVDVDKVHHWNGRGHFFGAAAEAMRRILVDRARRKRRLVRGGEFQRVELDEGCSIAEEQFDQVLIVDEALSKLAAESPEKCELVKLRYFTGMTVLEAAEAMGISRATADRYWAYAKVFLYCEMEDLGKTENLPAL